MDSHINKKAISALGTIADANVGLSTKVPVQRPNQIPFEQVTLNQIKRSIIAECTTAAATANKTATVTNFADFELIPGLDILVYFKAENTANNITLSINDSNAYPIKALGTADQLGNGSIKAGAYKKLTFTGDSFITEAPTISVMNSESDLPLNSAAVSTELSTKYYNKQSVDAKLSNFSNVVTFHYGEDVDISSQDGLIITLFSNYNNTENYNEFKGFTAAGQEGVWHGFKHNDYGEGILISRGKICGFYIAGEKIIVKSIMSF